MYCVSPRYCSSTPRILPWLMAMLVGVSVSVWHEARRSEVTGPAGNVQVELSGAKGVRALHVMVALATGHVSSSELFVSSPPLAWSRAEGVADVLWRPLCCYIDLPPPAQA